MKKNGFTLIEVLVATFMIALIAAGTHLLLGSATHFGVRRSHAYEAMEYGGQTFDTLKDYVTANPNQPAPNPYHLIGDSAPEGCPGPGGPNRYALRVNPVAQPHCHPLPAGSALDNLGATRTYTVQDIDLDSDGNIDYKLVEVTVGGWTEPQ